MPVRLSPAVTSAMSLSLYIQRIFDDLFQELEANTRAGLHSWTGRIGLTPPRCVYEPGNGGLLVSAQQV